MISDSELCRVAVVLEEPTEALAALDLAAIIHALSGDQFVVEPLVISLAVKVSKVLRSGSPKKSLPEEDEPIEALLLDRSHEAFGAAFRLGLRRGSLMLLTPDSRSIPMNWSVNLVSRSCMRVRFSRTNPSSSSVRFRAT